MKKKTFRNLSSLSIVIPFFNEKKRLHIAFKNINTFIKKKYINITEILFVDDGSTDNGNILIKKFFLTSSKGLHRVNLLSIFLIGFIADKPFNPLPLESLIKKVSTWSSRLCAVNIVLILFFLQ